MAYTQVTFVKLRQELAQRLNDNGMVFSTDAELKLHIQDALRFWNILTGDNKVNYPLAVSSANVYYDLHSISGSPRQCTLTDRDVYLRLTYSLLEPPSNLAAVTTGQFLQDDLVQAVQRKRDEFLFKTACTSVVESLSVNPNIATIALPQSVIRVMRAYWLPTAIPNTPSTAFPVFRSDEFATSCYSPQGSLTPGKPETFSVGMEPLLTLEMTPPPDRNGKLECLTIESQGVLSPLQATMLLIPQDFVPGLFWGAMSDLLLMSMEKQDTFRGVYAKQRFDEYVALMDQYPFVFSSRIKGIPTSVDAVEQLDYYNPSWRAVTASPSNIGLSGQNLVCYPSSSSSTIILSMLANANIPVLDGDFIQLGDEVLDVILDEAFATASFKQGGAEAQSAWELHGNIVKLAAQRNGKVRSMSIFRDLLYGRSQRESLFVPKEILADSSNS